MTNKPILELLDFCIINIDKPSGPTSFKVCEKVRNILDAKKAGHFGTLDPKVTGVLPIAINRACRLSNYFMGHDKEYVGKMYLHKDIPEEKLIVYMNEFIGKIMQKPPVKSRVKRVNRERIVNKFKIIKKEGKNVWFLSDVQAGTYIRKLVSDLGEKIGGAHMTELKRVRAGIFLEKDSHTIEEVEVAVKKHKENIDDNDLRKILIPAEIINQIITSVQVKEEAIKELLNGKPLMKKDIIGKIPNSDIISVFYKDRFIEIAKKVDDTEILARPEFVLN